MRNNGEEEKEKTENEERERSVSFREPESEGPEGKPLVEKAEVRPLAHDDDAASAFCRLLAHVTLAVLTP